MPARSSVARPPAGLTTTLGPASCPPDWSGGYTSLFALQQKEEWDEQQLETVTAQHAQMKGSPTM